MLRCDNDPETGFWGKLLQFYKNRDCIVDAKLFPCRPDELQFRKGKQEYAMTQAKTFTNQDDLHTDKFKQLAPRFQRLAALGEQTHRRHYDGSESDSDSD